MPQDGFRAQHRFVETADVSRATLALLYQAAIDMLGTLPAGDPRRGISANCSNTWRRCCPCCATRC